MNSATKAAESGTHRTPPQATNRMPLLHVGLRRARFVARFIYWTWRHGSTKHAGWVCNFEGLYW